MHAYVFSLDVIFMILTRKDDSHKKGTYTSISIGLVPIPAVPILVKLSSQYQIVAWLTDRKLRYQLVLPALLKKYTVLFYSHIAT